MFIQPQKILALSKELEKKNPKLHGKYYAQIKYNGWYVQVPYTPESGWGVPLSSAGRAIPSLEKMPDTLFRHLPKPTKPTILIAEVVLQGLPFHEMNGLLNRSKGNYLLDEATFYIHDYIQSSSEIHNSVIPFDKIYRERLNVIQSALSHLNKDIIPVGTVLYSEYNKDLWYKAFMSYVEKGEEGLVFKRDTHIYMPGKRNSDVLKLKMECTIDALAYDLKESVGEKGNLAYTLYSKRKNGAIIKTVIAKHSLINDFLKDKSLWYNKVVEIKGMEEMPDGTIYQPVFVRVRNDKSINDFN
jgi:hypothetical protein